MIYLLGCKGFVGSAIAKYLKMKKVRFAGIDRDNYNSFVGKQCGIFINVGGSSKKKLADEDTRKDFELNVVSTLNTIFDFKFRKYILISSIDVYNDVSNPKNNKETAEIDTSKLSNYGFSKWLCEQIVRKYCKNWLILRLGGMLGDGLRKNAIFDLLTKQSLYVHPKSEYQYMDTKDVARIVYMLRNRNNEIFNVCGDGTITLEKAARAINVNLTRDLHKLRREKYSININKLKSLIAVEKTKNTTRNFMLAYGGRDEAN